MSLIYRSPVVFPRCFEEEVPTTNIPLGPLLRWCWGHLRDFNKVSWSQYSVQCPEYRLGTGFNWRLLTSFYLSSFSTSSVSSYAPYAQCMHPFPSAALDLFTWTNKMCTWSAPEYSSHAISFISVTSQRQCRLRFKLGDTTFPLFSR